MPRSHARNPLRPLLGRLITVALALCLGAGPALAQFFQFPFGQEPQSQTPPRAQPQAPPRVPKVQPEAPPPEVTTPYDPDLQRLAEILGALRFLREICGADDALKWRDEAQTLIEAEAPTGKRHDAMVQSFNRGYLGFQQSYRTCTPAAKIVVRRYLEEGARIARDITARYAN
jgi:uncharacterized protein (TIGR02301 family)